MEAALMVVELIVMCLLARSSYRYDKSRSERDMGLFQFRQDIKD